MTKRAHLYCVAALLLSRPALAAPTHFVGVNTHLPGNDVLDAVKDLGMSWIRIDVNWLDVQPNASSPPNFALIDKVAAEAKLRGLKVFATLAYGPAWATEPDTDGKPHNNVPKPGEYQKFCQAAAAHFGANGTITHLGTWNEPNLKEFFEGTQQQWIDRIAVEGIKGIKAGCPSCQTVGPELASVGSGYDTWFDAGLKQLKQAGLMWNIISWHDYSGFLETKQTWNCWDGDLFIHDLDQHRVCFGINGSLSVREVLLNNGLGNLSVWISETGYTAALGDQPKLLNQLTYYRRVMEEQLQRSWYTHTFFYEIVDDNNATSKWGMATRTGPGQSFPKDWTLKPVFAYVKQVLAKAPGFGGAGDECHDGLDNDGDKKIDAAGLDIDGDKKADLPPDPECAAAGALSETPAAPGDAGARLDGSGTRDGSRLDRGSASEGGGALDVASGDSPSAAELGTSTPSKGGSGGCGCGAIEGATTISSGALVMLAGLVLALRRRYRARY